MVAVRTDGAEQIDGIVAQVASAARADALLEPAAAGAADLADPGLVQEPDLEATDLGMGGLDLGNQGREVFFKCLLRLGIGLRMDRPGLLPGETEPVQQVEHAVPAVAHPEAVLDDPAQVLGGPAADAIALGIGPAQHQGLEGRHLALVERGWAAAAWTIAQAVHALGVEADHPVPERLPVHPGLLGRLFAAHAVERIGQSQDPAGDPAIRLQPSQPSQFHARNIAPDRQRRTHPRLPLIARAKGNHVLRQTTSQVSQNIAGSV